MDYGQFARASVCNPRQDEPVVVVDCEQNCVARVRVSSTDFRAKGSTATNNHFWFISKRKSEISLGWTSLCAEITTHWSVGTLSV